MVVRLGSRPQILVLSGLLLGFLAAAGCAKSGGPAAAKTELAQPTEARTESPNAAGNCDPANAAALLAEIARGETEKTALEKTAKESPAKANFRKLYDAETAFAAATEEKVAKLTACGAAPDTLADLKNKIAKSRANVTYLSESFPDFK